MFSSDLIDRQRSYFLSGATRSYEFRIEALNKLKNAIVQNENLIYSALSIDLNKSRSESFMLEIGQVYDELNFTVKHLKKWMKNVNVKTNFVNLPAKSYQSPEPYGVTLIMSPWNYPIGIGLSPLVGAIAAGNCVVLKPSSYASATSGVIAKIIGETFDEEYIAVVQGGREENSELLKQHFDFIFFTGSTSVGKVVMKAASENLTPVVLELGGKSPVIIDRSAKLSLAAKRIAFGKIVNAGQTCVAPDYVFIPRDMKKEFIEECGKALAEFFPGGNMSDMPTIINAKHYKRVKSLLDCGDIVLGGKCDDDRRFIEPTIMDNVRLDSPLMQEEIFGPVLPLVAYDSIDEIIESMHGKPKPLAFYIFTEDKKVTKKLMNSCSFGGGCINDTIMHVSSPYLQFGGVGLSGMGSYHGRKSFETFSHMRSIMDKSTLIDIKLRYRPYTEKKDKIIKNLLDC